MSMFQKLKYNFDVEDWAVTTVAAMRAQGRDPHLLISRDSDDRWCIVGVEVDGGVVLAPTDVIVAWARNAGVRLP